MKRKRLGTLGPRIGTLDTRTIRPAPKYVDPLYQSSAWRDLLKQIYAERGRRCEDCGATEGQLYGDHEVEIRDGGAPLDPTNVRIRCASCHQLKTHRARARRHGLS